MSKMYFRYGAMNAGKTSLLLQVAYNYEERDHKVVIIKSSLDTKGDDTIVTRSGLKRKVDILLAQEDSLVDFDFSKFSCILVDEAQFLTAEQVDELYEITKFKNIPVICYGLRSDFNRTLFPGSKRILEICDVIEELITICRCGKRAKFNGRIVNGEFTNVGNQVCIETVEDVSYESLCGICYLKKVLKKEE